MESNRTILFFIFGISLLPKIYSVVYPSLIVKKPNKNYAVADEIQYFEDENNVITFSTSPHYQLYNACPVKDASRHPPHTLKVQESVVDFEARLLQKFFEGDFPKYNCGNPIRPIVFQCKQSSEDNFAIEHDIGFLIYEKNGNFDKLSEKYENFNETDDYDFLHFLSIKMDRLFGTVQWVRHRIISRGLLQPDSALDPLPPNEENADVYGFDINSLYKKENQRKVFYLIFGNFYFRYYNHPSRCLIKVQLAPHEDFLLNTWKLPTFMDLNTAAMWKQLYPQWRTIEMFIRKVARDLEPLIVETGTAKILTLPVSQTMSQPVYLGEAQTFPVSQYFWKLVKFEKSVYEMNTQAILIVMHNDPYTQNQELICEDVGKNLGWMVSNNDYETGLTYVCPVDENVTSKLYIESKGNYASLNLNNMQKVESDKNDIYPSLFITKKPNNNYAVAEEFQHVIEDENHVFKFSTSAEYQLHNTCPEKNARFYRTYVLKVQEFMTDFEAKPLEQFIEGDFPKYNCRYPIKPVVLQSKQRLKNNFLIDYHIGFLIHDSDANFDKLSEKYENFTDIQEYDFLQFLTIHISKRLGTTVEAYHQIVDTRLPEHNLPYSDLFQLNEKNLNIFGFDINSLYTEQNQWERFTYIFPEVYSNYYNYPYQSLRKVQLVPHEDFQLEIWKLPSFMDLNTAAMWEQLYSQWRRIEIFVRKVARHLGALDIQTGTSKILTLHESGIKRKAIFLLKKGRFPVRKYMWKLIKLRQSKDYANTQAILIVMHNDPYTSDQEPICEDVSEKWGWMVSNKDYKTGLTYGCQVVEHNTIQLHDEFKLVNYPSFNLNKMKKWKYDKNDIYPSLFIIKKPNNSYAVADRFQYIEGENKVLKFTTSPEYQLYNACPEENAPFHPTYALEVQESVTDFEARPLEPFVQGDFVNYNCSTPIKPIVLKSKKRFRNRDLRLYHIGFLIHDADVNSDKLSEKYENFTEIQEYDFLQVLTIKMDRRSRMAVEVYHQIVGGGLLELDSAYSDQFQPNEKNYDIYGFDVDSSYTEESQRSVFTSTFPGRHSVYFSYPNKSLRKVQLAPHEDFPLNTWKLPSFMDLNTTSIWEQLYSQWRRIEIFVRNVARHLGALTIETGAARFLSLLDVANQRQVLNLLKWRRFPVRRYIWKLIKLKQSDNDVNIQAVLIIMHNDPYSPDQKPICDDLSEKLGWMVSNDDYETGLTYVCPVDENITSILYIESNVNYASLNLNNVQKLVSEENGEDKWVNEDIASKIRSQ